MTRFLVPVDGSTHSIKALQFALNQAVENNSEIILLNVQPSYNTPNVKRFVTQEQIRAYQSEESNAAFEKALAETKNSSVSVETKTRVGEPGIEICTEAKESQVAQIIMGYRGLGAIKRTVLGSVSYKVIHEAPCPVTIVP
ncbi:universal stress protein [Bacillus sp. REN16]|uniref:universal stress protein n=1 Tax=Bacillus sp. REN16 TaxID=2887296 RepID=UPI001E37201A|nr:universal stress protein [Bacillus sp. REN16]MCC3355528.1 universal stress protein [Bacillus sp. REN16]